MPVYIFEKTSPMPDDTIGGEMLKGHVAPLVLAILEAKARHGYEIMKTLEERSDGVFDLGQGTIYPLLYSLEDQGLIRGKERVVDGRRRKVYSLTASGRRSLKKRIARWRIFQRAVDTFLTPEARSRSDPQ